MPIELIISDAFHSPYANAKTVQELMKIAVKLEDKMLISREYSDEKPSEYQRPIKSGELNNQYYYTNGVISFVYDNDVYEIPYTPHAVKILRDAGFQLKEHWITLCNGNYPTEQKEYWEYLISVSRVLNALQKRDDDKKLKEELVSLCEKKGLKRLSPELYERCFCMPDSGVKVRNTDRNNEDGYVDFRSPSLFADSSKRAKLKDLVGKYSKFIGGGGHSGRYTFVDFDGTVYVTESEKVMAQLRANGFEQSEEVRHVGLGWYEEFEDPWLQRQYSETVISDEDYEKRKAEREKDPYGKEAAVQELTALRNELKKLQEENELLKAQRDNSFNTVSGKANGTKVGPFESDESKYLSEMFRDVVPEEPVEQLTNDERFEKTISDSNYDNFNHSLKY